MIKKLLHFLIKALLVLLIFISAGFSQTEKHRLHIIAEKPFELFLNDFSFGTHLYFDTLLQTDVYKIEAYIFEDEPIKNIFKKIVYLNADLIIRLDSFYFVNVRSNPDDAQVYFDSLYFGATPLNLKLLFKPTLLELRKNGYKVHQEDISDFYNYDFFIKLEKEKFEKPSFVFDYKYIALSSTIISGALAAYTKQLANKFFYKLDRSDEDLRKVKVYDRYSGIFTIGMEISFGIFVYLLLQE
ncbi:MAG: PEGA domain-containing protein [Ignavibacteria bacterium]|jgi:hypothetical protein|nr:PEGA domain-containing protein [Ignavibacteria bacterium]MDH7528407.1 PEGA domain-containing protein [Ignavibacteria bacterium]